MKPLYKDTSDFYFHQQGQDTMLPCQSDRKSTFSKRLGFSADDYETPTYVLDMLLEELDPDDWVLWEPFPGSGYSTKHMRSRGFEVTNGMHLDFFDHETIPIPVSSMTGRKLAVVTNPPYSQKKRFLAKLKALGVEHIALFVPVGTITNDYFRRSFPQQHNQFIFHQLACHFLHPKTHDSVGSASFEVMWVTCGLGMKNNVMYKRRR